MGVMFEATHPSPTFGAGAESSPVHRSSVEIADEVVEGGVEAIIQK